MNLKFWTAGIFILIRSSPILEFSSTALLVIALVGATTTFFAATIGVLQNDLKRIIAFSTISQLGYMVLSIGLSQYSVSLFHTVNHAFFKALLFLSAGQAIHSILDQQDIRRMGGLKNLLPFVYSVMIVGSLSLMAIPFLSGFYSKDLILELAFSRYDFLGLYVYIFGTMSAALTAFYSFRLISLVFLTLPNASYNTYSNVHESNISVIIPLSILSLFSIFFGYIFSDLFVGMGSDFFGNSLFTHPNNIYLIEAESSLPIYIKLTPLFLSILGGYLGIISYNTNIGKIINFIDNPLGRKIYTFLNAKYLLDIIYNRYIIGFGLRLGYNISKLVDRGVIELVGPYGISNKLINTGINISKLDTGIVTTYSIYMTLSLLFLLFLIFAPILIKTSLLNEMRLVIIYISALMITLSLSIDKKNISNR
jgi:NADH-ubiquinone oxidoreductase chain 5